MAKDNHLYTVYHSLDNKGAFDPPDGNPDPDGVQGKYWQEKTEYPKYIRGSILVDGDLVEKQVIVADADEEKKVLEAWSNQNVLEKQTSEIHARNAAEAHKNELMAKAKKLGIKVDGRFSEKKLAYMIEEAETANEEKVA